MPISNPSHGQAFFSLALDRDGVVTIQAFGAHGRKVADLINAGMPAGVYAVRAKSGQRVVATRIVMLPR